MEIDCPLKQRERSTSGKLLVDIVAQVIVDLLKATSSNASNSTPINNPTTDISSNNENDANSPMESDKNKEKLTKFHGVCEPAISITDYILRISKYSGCSDQCFIIFLIYIDRLISKRKITVDKCNIHRIVLISILMAVKYFDDHYFDNVHYATLGGIPLLELNELEIEYCFLSDFQYVYHSIFLFIFLIVKLLFILF